MAAIARERHTRRASETDRDVFAERLRETMQKQKLNQTQLAKKIADQEGSLTRQTISLYVNGQSKPDTDILTMLCDVLNVSADYLLGRTDDPRKDAPAADQLGITPEAIIALEELSLQFGDLLPDVLKSPGFFGLLASMSRLKVDTQNMKAAVLRGWKEDIEYQRIIDEINSALRNEVPLSVVHPRHAALLELSQCEEIARKLAMTVSGYDNLSLAEKNDPAFAADAQELHEYLQASFSIKGGVDNGEHQED